MQKLNNYDVIYFSGSFCNPCKVSKPFVEKVSNEKNIKTLFFIVDEEIDGKEIADLYNIKAVPTILFLKDGLEIGRNVGAVTEQKFSELHTKYFSVNS